MKQPLVTLVGAGPGHPDLLTVRGLRRLQAAEVVLYDALLDDSFLELFPPTATCISVGKRCGAHSVPQEEICALLVSFGQQGRRTVRLKGGDPLLYGRGGEEILALAEAGIACEIVPGVSSLNGVGGAAGIPLTHRGIGDRVLVMNGPALLRDVPIWVGAELERGLTLAVFMGAGRVREIAVALLGVGAPAVLPVALVEAGSLTTQKVRQALLGDVAQGALDRSCADTQAAPNSEPPPGILYFGFATAALAPAQALLLSPSNSLEAPCREPVA